MKTPEELVWTEKYRPKTVDECILPARLKKPFKAFVKNRSFPNLLLSGSAGTGKTTIAKALCNELDYDYILINASDERNIDVVRGRIKSFASQTSFEGKSKAIILDESDGLNPSSAQPALRAAMEEFHTVKFILTCNYKNKIIQPIQSRASLVSFNIKAEERLDCAAQLLKRVFEILQEENIQFDKAAVGALVKKFYPDNRRILNELQAYSQTGSIDSGIVAATSRLNTDDLVTNFKSKNFAGLRKWVVDNIDTDPEFMFADIYEGLYHAITPECVPQLIITLADYQYKSAFAANQEINMMGLMAEILRDVEFR